MNHPLQFVLLADIFELIGSLVGLVFLVLWIVRQIMEANKQVPPARGGPAGAPPRPQQAGRGGVQAAGQQADPLRNQVEDFLRRAARPPQANQAAAPQRAAQPAAASEIELLLDDEQSAPDPWPLAEPLRPAESRPAEVPQRPAPPQPAVATPAPRVARRPVAPRRRETLAERAASREGARAKKIARQTSQLGQRIIADDQQFDVQLKAKFDHSVGTLTGSAVTAAEQAAAAASATTTPAAQIASMLANPDGVRQAIILNEILRRPSDRW